MATTHTIPERGDATTLSSRAKRLIMAGVLLGLFLEATDQTIVATALPAIVREFQGLGLLGWVTTGYLLASTALVPVYGRLSDRYGRRAIVLWSISVFLLGSILCGLAGSMLQLVVFRVVQGWARWAWPRPQAAGDGPARRGRLHLPERAYATPGAQRAARLAGLGPA